MAHDRIIGFHVDAMAVGIVAMELSRPAGFSHIYGTREMVRNYQPEVFYSYFKEGLSISEGIEILGSVIGPSTKIFIEGRSQGSLAYNEVKKQLGIAPHNFYQLHARSYDIEEILVAILDDLRNKVITTREDYEGTPQREELMRHLAQIDGKERMSAIQSAFVWAAGYWSINRTRKKWKVGRSQSVRVW